MANDNFPRGLVPLNWPKMPVHFYRVDTTQNIFLGMPVDQASTGFVTPAIDVTTAGIVQAIGVVVGFAGPNKAGLAGNDSFLRASDLTTLAANLPAGDRFAIVADDPNQLFVVQGDTGGTLATLTAAGETVALIYRATTGNTSSGWANLEFDASTNAASTGQLLRLVQLHDSVNVDGTNNTAGANFQKWVVKINTHRNTQANLASAI